MSFKTDEFEDYKLVIAGLDNAGKTSALIALRQKYNFYERVKNLKPTIRIDYSSFRFLHTRVNLWDMGGQAKFRKIYIDNPIYFTETDCLYYLIDIQDELKFQESAKYLYNLLEIYRDLEYKNEIAICFNKYDPKYKQNPDFADRAAMIKNLILTQNQDMKFVFFNTSCYDISSISRAISHSLNKILNLEEVSSELNRLVSNFYCNYAILYTDSGLIISDCYRDSMDTREFENVISNKLNDDLEFFQRLKDEQVNIDDRVTFSNESAEYVKRYVIESGQSNNVFYLGISAPPQRLNEIKIELEKAHPILETTLQ